MRRLEINSLSGSAVAVALLLCFCPAGCTRPKTGVSTADEAPSTRSEQAGGTYQGDGTVCDPDPCPPPPPGACCGPGGECVVALAEDCVLNGGIFQGEETVCDHNPCLPATGACCVLLDTCVVATPDDCELLGGTYQGDDSVCFPTPCFAPTGACCLAHDRCTFATAENCTLQGGTYQGDGSLCTPDPCVAPVTGACCLEDDTCQVVAPGYCSTLGGAYQGDDTACSPDPCAPQPGRCFLATLIDFDDSAAPIDFGLTVALTDKYAALGVTFEGPSPLDGGAILDEDANFQVSEHSSRNFLAFHTGLVGSLSNGGTPQGPETLYFDPAARFVEIRAAVGWYAPGNVTLTAYDSGDAVLDSATMALAWQLRPISVSSSQDITKVIAETTAEILALDDLRYGSTCVEVTADECTELGGAYDGGGTTCDGP